MPWEPLHHMFCTRILVLFGLKDTQSGVLYVRRCGCLKESEKGLWKRTISVIDHGILNGQVGATVRIPAIGILGRIIADTSTGNIDVVKHNIG